MLSPSQGSELALNEVRGKLREASQPKSAYGWATIEILRRFAAQNDS
jgi:hypothetical protein